MIPTSSKCIGVDWLNDVLHSSGFLTRASITSVRHEPWGIGEGFVSDTARLSLAYDREDPHLPETIIAKLPASYQPARVVTLPPNIYQREILFYTEVAPQSPVRTPGFIYSESDFENQRYILLLEDCSHYARVDQITGLDAEQTKLVATKLADFQAHWWDNPELFFFPWLRKPGRPEAMALADIFRTCWDAAAQIEDFVNNLPEGGWEAGLKLYEHYPWLIESIPDKHLTIAHRDFKADNMFFDWTTLDDPLIVCDWGGVSISRGVIDLAYLVGSSVPTGVRRAIEKDTVKLYYERLLERGVSGYSPGECWHDYRKGLLFFTFIGLLAVTRLDMSDPRGTELLRVAIPRYIATILDNDAVSILP